MRPMSGETLIHCPIKSVPDVDTVGTDLEPLLAHLEADRAVDELTSFPVGTVMPDGRLDLCKQNLGPAGCRRVTRALLGNSTIKSVMLGTDGIGDSGAVDVAGLIEQSSSVETIYLGCNVIGTEGAKRLAGALKHNNTVRGLWLKRNPIGDDGVHANAEMLRVNRTIRVVDLVNTNTSMTSYAELIDVLIHRNRTVEHLYLGGNAIGPDLAAKFAELLRASPAIKRLLLNVTHLGDIGLISIANSLVHNRTLEGIGLASNGIGPEGAMALAEAIVD